jgi:hypothetical protein
MIETVIIAFVVTAAAVYIGRSLYRTVAGRKSTQCDCKDGCALSEQCPTADVGPAAGRDTDN